MQENLLENLKISCHHIIFLTQEQIYSKYQYTYQYYYSFLGRWELRCERCFVLAAQLDNVQIDDVQSAFLTIACYVNLKIGKQE
jgi:hypothetical protein